MTLSQIELDVVRDILRRIVPTNRVAAFGSRAKGTTKQFADLDLVIFTTTPLPLSTLATLRDAFSESSLPFRVDIVDAAGTSKEFLAAITDDMITLQDPL